MGALMTNAKRAHTLTVVLLRLLALLPFPTRTQEPAP